MECFGILGVLHQGNIVEVVRSLVVVQLAVACSHIVVEDREQSGELLSEHLIRLQCLFLLLKRLIFEAHWEIVIPSLPIFLKCAYSFCILHNRCHILTIHEQLVCLVFHRIDAVERRRIFPH